MKPRRTIFTLMTTSTDDWFEPLDEVFTSWYGIWERYRFHRKQTLAEPEVECMGNIKDFLSKGINE